MTLFSMVRRLIHVPAAKESRWHCECYLFPQSLAYSGRSRRRSNGNSRSTNTVLACIAVCSRFNIARHALVAVAALIALAYAVFY